MDCRVVITVIAGRLYPNRSVFSGIGIRLSVRSIGQFFCIARIPAVNGIISPAVVKNFHAFVNHIFNRS